MRPCRGGHAARPRSRFSSCLCMCASWLLRAQCNVCSRFEIAPARARALFAVRLEIARAAARSVPVCVSHVRLVQLQPRKELQGDSQPARRDQVALRGGHPLAARGEPGARAGVRRRAEHRAPSNIRAQERGLAHRPLPHQRRPPGHLLQRRVRQRTPRLSLEISSQQHAHSRVRRRPAQPARGREQRAPALLRSPPPLSRIYADLDHVVEFAASGSSILQCVRVGAPGRSRDAHSLRRSPQGALARPWRPRPCHGGGGWVPHLGSGGAERAEEASLDAALRAPPRRPARPR